MQLLEVAVRLPPFKPPKVASVEYEAPQLLPLPQLLDEEVCYFDYCTQQYHTISVFYLSDRTPPTDLGVALSLP